MITKKSVRKLTGLIAFYYKIRLLAKYFELIDVTEINNGMGEVSIHTRLPQFRNSEREIVSHGCGDPVEVGIVGFSDIDFPDAHIKELLKKAKSY